MTTKVKIFLGSWVVPLLMVSGPGFASDLRLVEAVKEGNRAAVRSLLKEQIDVNAPEPDGATALAWAAHKDDLETAELLIRAGADVDAANDYGVAPLSLACTNGNAAMIGKLLKAGADPNAATRSGETALMMAARSGSAQAVKLLLDSGADVNAKENWRGQTALMWAVAEKHSEAVRLLTERGADVNARSENGFTPLMFAAQQGDLDSARALLAAGADVNAVIPIKDEPSTTGRPQRRKVEGAPEGMTPLLMAAASGHEGLAIFLLQKGADPNAADSYGATALHYALQRGMAILDALFVHLKASANWFRPHMLNLVKELLARGANPNAQLVKHPNHSRGDATVGTTARFTMVGVTPFMLATATLDLDLMRYLIERRANPLLAAKGGTTPLLAAAGLGHTIDRTEEERKRALEAAKMLVELGADVNAVGDRGYTALHGAAYVGDDAMVQYLVEKGAKMGVMDTMGQTPLSIAEGVITTGVRDFQLRPRTSHKTTANLLLKLGATPLAASGVKILAVEDGVDQALGNAKPKTSAEK